MRSPRPSKSSNPQTKNAPVHRTGASLNLLVTQHHVASLDAWASPATVTGHLTYLVALLAAAVWFGIRGLQRRLVV